MNRNHTGLVVAAALLLSPAASTAAVPEVSGIPNFHQVGERLYRGGQPADDAWPGLAKLGVRTVIDLRRGVEHSVAAESTAVTAAGMRYVNFPMNGFDTPTRDQIACVLAMFDGNDRVFVHCKQGRDRTGTVIAAYRVSRDHWTNSKALDEARDLGLHWFEAGMKRFITGYRSEPAALAAASPGAADTVNAATATEATP